MNVPAELAELEQWVAWRYEERSGKRTKVPLIPSTPARRASSTDAATWGSLAAALHAAEEPGVDGIGFVFSGQDPFAGVDLDDCVSGVGVHPAVADIVARLDSYTEMSPSGTGLHVIVKATVNGGRKRTASTPWGAEFENYNTGRFFCVTGEHLAGTPLTVNDRQEQLDAIRAELLPNPESPKAREPASPSTLDDRELLERARAAKNGATFDRLWAGDTSGHGGDDSAADLALCGLLAFWTGPDAARIDGLFRQSALIRDKWDERRGDSTYGAQTIEKAISGCSEFYASQPRAQAAPSAAEAPAAGTVCNVTWTDDKTPKLVLPPTPEHGDLAGQLAWITVVLRFDPQHPAIGATHEGLRGQDGQIEIRRADATPLRFEPASVIDTARRFGPALGWQLLRTDGERYGFKDAHCSQIAHVIRLLCGADAAPSAAQEAAAIVGSFTLGAKPVEGLTTYGTPAQRHEAVEALRPDLDSHSGRAVGPPRFLIDDSTGELVIRVGDLQDAARKHVGASLPHGWLDARIDNLGWMRAALQGYAHAGREGRKGPHSRCDVYRGHLPADDCDDASVNT